MSMARPHFLGRGLTGLCACLATLGLTGGCGLGSLAPGRDSSLQPAPAETRGSRSVAPDGVMPWRIQRIERTDTDGVPRTEEYVYDVVGNLLRVEQREAGRVYRTVVYALAPDGRMQTRVDIEPDDLDRFLYRYRDARTIHMRLRDGDADGRFGSYLLFRFDDAGRANAVEHYDIARDAATVTAGDGAIDWRLDFTLDADGRLIREVRDDGADGRGDLIAVHRYDNLGRIASSIERRDGEVVGTRRYVYQRGPCRLEQFPPSRLHYCIE